MKDNSAAALHGLYGITPAWLLEDETQLLQKVSAAIRGGARLIQYRDKRARPNLAQAQRLRACCHAEGARLLINDDLELALACGADGVHLGAQDGTAQQARQRLGAEAIVGITCGDSLQRARAAVAGGASYVAFGRFYPSQTKPDAPPAQIETLRLAAAELAVPVCAIGGITPGNAPALIAAGAQLIAAVEGLFGAEDVAAAARAYCAAFAKPSPHIP